MREQTKKIFSLILVVVLVAFICSSNVLAQERGGAGARGGRGGRGGFGMGAPADDGIIRVTIAQPENGSISISPEIPEDGIVEEGTVLTVTATPDDGFALDAVYHSGMGGMFGGNFEFMTPEVQITIDKGMTIGVSFIEEETVAGINVTNNIEYAKPGVKTLKYDVFSPDGAENLPCIIIVHGGGWSSNTEDVTRGYARELAKPGDYVVFSIDHRWLGTGDGDEVPNTMANLIEDVFGGIAHVYEHAEQYGGDPTRMAVTGVSSGGHLSACAITMIEMIGDGGFGETEGIYQYKPTYIPEGKSADQIRDELLEAIQVAAPSCGVFDVDGQEVLSYLGDSTEAEIDAVSPIMQIPDAEERKVPHYLTRGSNDLLITNVAVQSYADALKAAGQRVEYVQIEGAGHAFFGWKVDSRTKATFAQYGVPYAAETKEFFDSVFYPEN